MVTPEKNVGSYSGMLWKVRSGRELAAGMRNFIPRPEAASSCLCGTAVLGSAILIWVVRPPRLWSFDPCQPTPSGVGIRHTRKRLQPLRKNSADPAFHWILGTEYWVLLLSWRHVHATITAMAAAITSDVVMRPIPKPPSGCGFVSVSPSVAPRGRVRT
jgi:hypothetical protein